MLTLLLCLVFSASAGPVAFVGGTIHPVSSPPIESGILVIDDGEIIAVGDSSTDVPDGATIHDVTGSVVIPGLVDTHSHIANTGDLHEGGMTPQVSAIDGLDITLPSVKRAQAGGITTANVMPGSGTLMGGQTAYIKLRDGTRVDQLLTCGDRRTEICGGMKRLKKLSRRNSRLLQKKCHKL